MGGMTAIDAYLANNPDVGSEENRDALNLPSEEEAEQAYENDTITDSADKVRGNDDILADAGVDPTSGANLTVSDETAEEAHSGEEGTSLDDLQVEQDADVDNDGAEETVTTNVDASRDGNGDVQITETEESTVTNDPRGDSQQQNQQPAEPTGSGSGSVGGFAPGDLSQRQLAGAVGALAIGGYVLTRGA